MSESQLGTPQPAACARGSAFVGMARMSDGKALGAVMSGLGFAMLAEI